MADKHPYITSAGPVVQAVKHLRKSFPAKLDAQTLKKLGFAPKNESYLINILRFTGVIDDDGAETAAATKTFSQHADDAFQKSFGDMVKKAYTDLFGTYGDDAWDVDALITFFRISDHTSAWLVKDRQTASSHCRH